MFKSPKEKKEKKSRNNPPNWTFFGKMTYCACMLYCTLMLHCACMPHVEFLTVCDSLRVRRTKNVDRRVGPLKIRATRAQATRKAAETREGVQSLAARLPVLNSQYYQIWQW
jgi:hypothetical protein